MSTVPALNFSQINFRHLAGSGTEWSIKLKPNLVTESP